MVRDGRKFSVAELMDERSNQIKSNGDVISDQECRLAADIDITSFSTVEKPL
jgi:uncharacterized protein (DUF934 family)